MPDLAEYMYQTGEGDRERLGILNEVYNPHAQALLSKQDLSQKQAILEIACGQGDLLCWLAEQAPQAIVVGVDISGEQLRLAREKAQRRRLTNVHFVELSALNLEELPARLSEEYGVKKFSPDLIYSRWLLVHLKREHRRLVVEKAYKLLARAGCAIHEEVVLRQSYTESVAYRKWIDLFEELGRKIDVDFDCGEGLEETLRSVGYARVTTNSVKPEFLGAQQRFFNLDLHCTRALLLKESIRTSTELDALESEIAADLATGREMSMVNIQVVGNCSC